MRSPKTWLVKPRSWPRPAAAAPSPSPPTWPAAAPTSSSAAIPSISLGMKDREAIESRMVPRQIEKAQKKVEEQHFEARKNLLEYDEVMDHQRKSVYGFRQKVLNSTNCKLAILEMIDKQIEDNVER